MVVVAGADGFCGLVEGVAGRGAAKGDEGLFLEASPELAHAVFFEEVAGEMS